MRRVANISHYLEHLDAMNGVNLTNKDQQALGG